MDYKEYYKKWFSVAFSKAYSLMLSVSGSLAIFGKHIDNLLLPIGIKMGDLAWQIPMGIFVIILIIRLVITPYKIQKDESDKQQKLLDNLNADTLKYKNENRELKIRLNADPRELRFFIKQVRSLGLRLDSKLSNPNNQWSGIDEAKNKTIQWLCEVCTELNDRNEYLLENFIYRMGGYTERIFHANGFGVLSQIVRKALEILKQLENEIDN